jgi:hypothetical protein
VFTFTISGQETTSIGYLETMADLAPIVEAAILALPNIGTGLTVAAGTGTRLVITFTGDDNVGDGWAVSGRVINKADAAILSFKTTPGVAPGEPIISVDRGWPQCGTFWLQRLLIGGFKALPNAWGFSAQADYFNYDDRLTAATGPAIVPMDAGGRRGDRGAERFNQNLCINTSKAEYWIAERSALPQRAPSHVNSSTNGTKRGVPVVKNEGALIYAHQNGGVLSEFRKTDIEGNFVSTQLSLLAPHLVNDVVDLAAREGHGFQERQQARGRARQRRGAAGDDPARTGNHRLRPPHHQRRRRSSPRPSTAATKPRSSSSGRQAAASSGSRTGCCSTRPSISISARQARQSPARPSSTAAMSG